MDPLLTDKLKGKLEKLTHGGFPENDRVLEKRDRGLTPNPKAMKSDGKELGGLTFPDAERNIEDDNGLSNHANGRTPRGPRY